MTRLDWRIGEMLAVSYYFDNPKIGRWISRYTGAGEDVDASMPLISVTVEKGRLMPAAGAHYLGLEGAVDANCTYLTAAGRYAAVEFLGFGEKPSFSFRIGPDVDPVQFIGRVLEPLLRLALMHAGVLPLHASSASLDGRGVLLPAWCHTGKTNLILGLASRGAGIMGDDWSFLGGARQIFSNPKPAAVFDYNIRAFPEIADRLPRASKLGVGLMDITRSAGNIMSLRFGRTPARAADFALRALNHLMVSAVPLRDLAPVANVVQCHSIVLLRSVDRTEIQLRQVGKKELEDAVTEIFTYENWLLFCLSATLRTLGVNGIPDAAEISENYRALVKRMMESYEAGELQELSVPRVSDPAWARLAAERVVVLLRR